MSDATAAAPRTSLQGYLKQIDALRLLAVVVVMLHHYLDAVHFPLFGKGVILFFFLSGYFSTRQLLRIKERLQQTGKPVRAGVKVFYFRRYIRIFPMYYAIILVAAAANLPDARESLPWLATFTTNWHILLKGDWIGPFSPFWSLALLEQFYLFWPALLLALPRRWEVRATLLLAAVAIAWRCWCAATGQLSFMWFVVPWSGYDQVGLGALVAILHYRMAESARALAVLRRTGLLVAGPLSLFLLYGNNLSGLAGFHYIYEPALNCLFFIWLIDRASHGFSGLGGRLMGLPLVCGLGRASYSIFALHEFTVFLIPPFIAGLLAPVLETNWRFLVLIPVTLAIAWLSYKFIETPINRLKRFFTV